MSPLKKHRKVRQSVQLGSFADLDLIYIKTAADSLNSSCGRCSITSIRRSHHPYRYPLYSVPELSHLLSLALNTIPIVTDSRRIEHLFCYAGYKDSRTSLSGAPEVCRTHRMVCLSSQTIAHSIRTPQTDSDRCLNKASTVQA